MLKNILNLGDAALYCDFGNEINKETHSHVINYFKNVQKLKIEKNKITQSFLNKEYFCYMTGFVAGMPFLGDIDSSIRLQRLETPRVKVPKGSVGITEQFCNIYTFESPGGWNIIGNTPIKVFDKSNENIPVIINPGDRVTFYRINKEEYLKFNE